MRWRHQGSPRSVPGSRGVRVGERLGQLTGASVVRRVAVILMAVVVTVGVVDSRSDMIGAASAAPTSPALPSGTAGPLPKQCVGSDFATIGKVYDAIFDSVVGYLPPQVQRDKATIKAQAHRDMDRLRISNMLVSNHPKQLGAKKDDPIMKYRDPVSLWAVSQLMNIRHGKAFEAITVENMTLAQAVETAWMFIYLTVIIPLTIALGAVPNVATIWGPITVRFLVTLPFYIALYGVRYVYQYISQALLNSCIVSMTDEEKATAGQPVKDLRFAGSVPRWIEEMAGQVDLADKKNCKPIGDAPLSRIVTRTSDYLISTNPNPATKLAIAKSTNDLQNLMRNTFVPHNLIPADPADYNQIESVISLAGGYLIPNIGGAPLDILIGLVHNYHDGKNLGEQVRLSDLSVTKTMTAAYYTIYVAIYLVQYAYSQGLASDPAQEFFGTLPGPGGTTLPVTQLIPRPFGLFYAPLTFGFTAYHNVLRSMCFAEDRKLVS